MFVIAYQKDEDPAEQVRKFETIDYANKELVLAIGGVHRIEACAQLAGPNVILVEHPGGWKNVAYKRCYEKATGEIIVLTDANTRFVGDAFLRLVAPLVNGEEQASFSRPEPFPDQRHKLLVELRMSRSADVRAGDSLYSTALPGSGAAITRRALDAAGGFNPDVLGDDQYMAYRLVEAGFRILAVPASVVQTRAPDTIGAYIRQQARWTRAFYIDAPRLGRYKETLSALRGAIVGIVMLSLTASLPLTRRRGIFLLLPPLLHLYLRRQRRIVRAAQLGRFKWRPLHLWGALLQAYIDFVVSSRALVEFLHPRWRRRW